MDILITFGKYKGKTFEFVLNNDLKYCEYVLTLTSNNNNCKDLQEYLKVRIKEVASNKFNISALQKHRRINATDLVKYMA